MKMNEFLTKMLGGSLFGEKAAVNFVSANFFFLFLLFVCVYGKWKMLIAWISQLMNWLSCSQVVVDFSSIHNNLSRQRDRPTDCMSARPSDRQPNQCFYFSFVKKHAHILPCRLTAIDSFCKSVCLFFSMKPHFHPPKMNGWRKRRRKKERKGFVNALQAQISYDTFCSWHMISSDKLACGDFILCGQFFFRRYFLIVVASLSRSSWLGMRTATRSAHSR